MRAIVCRRIRWARAVAHRRSRDTVPGPGEVLVEIHAAPVNFVDLLVVGGTYQFLPERPFIPGKGPAGIVRACGRGVTALRAGDRVLAMAEQGGYAEAVAVAADQCYRLPARMSFGDSGVAEPRLRHRLVRAARARPAAAGRNRAGARRLGRGRLRGGAARARDGRPGACRNRPARDGGGARAAGADAVIDLSRANLRDTLREQVYDVTDGRGADIILDPLGGEVFNAALRALAWRGRLVVIGFAAGAIPTMRTNYLLLKNIEVSGLQISDYRKRRPAQVAAAFTEIFAFFETGLDIKPAPATLFPLERAGAALAALRDRRIDGRAVLRLRED